MTMATCFKCGAQLADGINFCGECGAPLMVQSQQAGMPYGQPQPQQAGMQYGQPQPQQAGMQYGQPQPPRMASTIRREKKYAKAKNLVLSPFIVFAFIAACFVIAMMMNVPMSSTNVIYRFCITVALLGGIAAPLPCLVMTVIGTVLSAKAMKEGFKQYTVFFVIGLIEIVLSVAITIGIGAVIVFFGRLV